MSAIRQASDTDTGPITAVYALPIDHPSAWKPADFRSPADYKIELTARQLCDVEHAIARVTAAGLGLDDLGARAFRAAVAAARSSTRSAIRSRRGAVFSSSAGCRSRRSRKDDLGMIFWGSARARAVAERARRPARPCQGFQPRGPARARLPQEAGAARLARAELRLLETLAARTARRRHRIRFLADGRRHPDALREAGGNRPLLELPTDWTLDDFPHYAHNRDLGYRMLISAPLRATEVFRSEFDAAWEFGALWISVWHPGTVRPARPVQGGARTA
jgi:hypothetical protein